MKIYLATWLLETSQGDALTKKGGDHRLLSYHFITDQKVTDPTFRKYCETGKADRNDRVLFLPMLQKCLFSISKDIHDGRRCQLNPDNPIPISRH